MCTLAKLFWSTICPTKCSEVLNSFGISQNVTSLLKSQKCYDKSGLIEITAQSLILNRLTPYIVNPEDLACISICTYHEVRKIFPKGRGVGQGGLNFLDKFCKLLNYGRDRR